MPKLLTSVLGIRSISDDTARRRRVHDRSLRSRRSHRCGSRTYPTSLHALVQIWGSLCKRAMPCGESLSIAEPHAVRQ